MAEPINVDDIFADNGTGDTGTVNVDDIFQSAPEVKRDAEGGTMSRMWDTFTGKRKVSVPKGDLGASARGLFRGATGNLLAPVVAGLDAATTDMSYDEAMGAYRASRKADQMVEPSAEIAGALAGAGKLSLGARAAKSGAGVLRTGAVGVGEGAAYGAGDAYATEGGDVKSGAAWGAGSAAAFNLLGRIGQKLYSPYASKADATKQAAVKRMENRGYRNLTAGQKLDNQGLLRAEAQAQEMGIGSKFRDTYDDFARDVTKSASPRGTATASGKIDNEWIEKVDDEFRSGYDTVRRNIQFARDQQLDDELRMIRDNFTDPVDGVLDAAKRRQLGKMVDDMRKRTFWNGKDFQAKQSALSKQIKSWRGDNNAMAEAASELRRAMDDAALRSASSGMAARRLKVLNRKYAQYRAILDASGKGTGANKAEGVLTPLQLQNELIKTNRLGVKGYRRAKTGVAPATRDAAMVGVQPPSSGTAANQDIYNTAKILGGGTLAGVGGLMQAGEVNMPFSLPNPGGYMMMAGGVLMGRPLLMRALMSKPGQAYLQNQITRGPEFERALGVATTAAGRLPGIVNQQQDRGGLTPEQMRLLLR